MGTNVVRLTKLGNALAGKLLKEVLGGEVVVGRNPRVLQGGKYAAGIGTRLEFARVQRPISARLILSAQMIFFRARCLSSKSGPILMRQDEQLQHSVRSNVEFTHPSALNVDRELLQTESSKES